MTRTLPRLLLLTTLACTSLACAGHSKKTLQAREALDAGNPDKALELINERLKVESGDELPEKTEGDNTLLILDRSMIQQQLTRYKMSSRDLELADKAIEMLDLRKKTIDSIGKYMFSDDVGPYQAPPYEKLLINTMNMANYLLRHDLSGAKVEARRFSIIRKYLEESQYAGAAMSAPGSYLAGFAFEKTGSYDTALLYYEEALQYGDFRSLVEPLERLTRGTQVRSQRIREFLEKYGTNSTGEAEPSGDTEASETSGTEENENVAAGTEAEVASAETPPTDTSAEATQDGGSTATQPAELLILLNYGRVPAKVPKRIPIGLALTYGSLFLSPAQSTTANELAAQGLVTWVNYPELEETKRKYLQPSAKIDGTYATLEAALSVDQEARAAYDKEKGKVIASAIIRMITRVVAGQGARAAAQAAGGDGLIGAIASIGTQAALTAADTPDTRSWSTLPGRIVLTRVSLPPGKHHIELKSQGEVREFDVDLAPGGWDVVGMTVLR